MTSQQSNSNSSLSFEDDSINNIAEVISSESYGSSSDSSFHFSEDSIERELSEQIVYESELRLQNNNESDGYLLTKEPNDNNCPNPAKKI